jgi:CDP-diacylglycerol---glycerol-3-phosphate 3-phosphatidyltransferase
LLSSAYEAPHLGIFQRLGVFYCYFRYRFEQLILPALQFLAAKPLFGTAIHRVCWHQPLCASEAQLENTAMNSVYAFKPKFQSLLRPFSHWLARSGVTANQVTVLAMLLSSAMGAAITIWADQHWPLLILPGVLLIRMALNALDGMLAREHNMQSRLGAVLNELGDVLSDSALYLPLALVPGMPAAMMVVLVLLAIIGEMTGVISVQIGARRRYDGPLGKSDRALGLSILSVWLGCGAPAGAWLDIGVGILIGLATLTIINRARQALAEVAV